MATWPTIIDDDGTGTSGTVLNKALFDEVKGYIGTAWAPITGYTLTAAGGSGGSWAFVSATLLSSEDPGQKRVFVDMFLNATVTGGPDKLNIAFPATMPTSAATNGGPVHYFGPASGTGYWQTIAGTKQIIILRDIGGTPWVAGSYYFVTQGSYVY